MRTKLLRTGIVLALLSSAFLFSGCSEKDLAVQKKECLKQDKKFFTKKVLNYRTGEYIIKGECV